MAAGHDRVAVIGKGRLGSAVARGLSSAGVPVSGPLGRGGTGDAAAIVLLCVPDREIANAAAMVPAGPLVGHCSGLFGPSAVGPPHVERFGFHPLMTVTHEGADFRGAAAAIAGSTPRALDAARWLALALSMEPIVIADENRAAYHAAASIASNYLVTIESAAERLSAAAGVERRHVLLLARAALENWGKHGSIALTGPIVRGDEDTVDRQRNGVAAQAPDLLPLWDALADATRQLASGRAS